MGSGPSVSLKQYKPLIKAMTPEKGGQKGGTEFFELLKCAGTTPSISQEAGDGCQRCIVAMPEHISNLQFTKKKKNYYYQSL